VSRRGSARCTLLGIGAAASPRYPPDGLLIEHRGARVAIDGGPGAEPQAPLNAWLVTDEQAELMPAIRRKARELGITAAVHAFADDDLQIEPHPVVHTSHPAFGYLIRATGRTVACAPEFLRFPEWAAGCDLIHRGLVAALPTDCDQRSRAPADDRPHRGHDR
jgi:hypothetical protein